MGASPLEDAARRPAATLLALINEILPNRLLRLIALFKLAIATLLIAVVVGAVKLLHEDVGSVVEHWVEVFKLDPNNHYINVALMKASNINPGKIKALGAGEPDLRWTFSDRRNRLMARETLG